MSPSCLTIDADKNDIKCGSKPRNIAKGLAGAALTATIEQMVRAIQIDPEIQGGTPCFAGTRVPVKSLFDSLAHGRSLDYFLRQFPTVTREQAIEVLLEAGRLVVAVEPQMT